MEKEVVLGASQVRISRKNGISMWFSLLRRLCLASRNQAQFQRHFSNCIIAVSPFLWNSYLSIGWIMFRLQNGLLHWNLRLTPCILYALKDTHSIDKNNMEVKKVIKIIRSTQVSRQYSLALSLSLSRNHRITYLFLNCRCIRKYKDGLRGYPVIQAHYLDRERRIFRKRQYGLPGDHGTF